MEWQHLGIARGKAGEFNVFLDDQLIRQDRIMPYYSSL